MLKTEFVWRTVYRKCKATYCCHNSFDVTNGNSCYLSFNYLEPEQLYDSFPGIFFLKY